MPRLEDQTRLVCRPSLPKTVGLLILNIAMLAAAWYVARIIPWWDLHEGAIVWFGLVFFSLTFIGWAVQPFRPSARVLIGPEGIEDRRARMALFRWSEIRRLAVVKYQSHRFLAVQVDRMADHTPPLRWWTRPFRPLLVWAPYYFGLDDTWHVIGLVGMTPGLPAAVAFLRNQLGKQVDEL